MVIKARHFFMSIESVLESKSTPPAMLFAKKKKEKKKLDRRKDV